MLMLVDTSFCPFMMFFCTLFMVLITGLLSMLSAREFEPPLSVRAVIGMLALLDVLLLLGVAL